MSTRIPNFFALHPDEAEGQLIDAGEPKYRARQLLEWIYTKHVLNLDEMTNLPQALRHRLPGLFRIELPKIAAKAESRDGTVKYLLELTDGQTIEMVLIPGKRHSAGRDIPKNTLCMSSQTACQRGCAFCATAQIGKPRNLEPEELVGQVMLATMELERRDPPAKLTNIVMMGMGEPMDNLPNVLRALTIMQHDRGLSFSPRRMTISTSGVVPGIRQLAESGVKVKLAVSLNAAIEEKRLQIMPVTKQYSLVELKAALLDFRRLTAYRVTLEYVMFGEFNLGAEDARALRKFAGDLSCKINLIPWNAVPGLSFKAPTTQEIERFTASLYELSAAVTLRQSRGQDIAAACGQLAGEKRSPVSSRT